MFYLKGLGFIPMWVYFVYALCTSAGVYLDVLAVIVIYVGDVFPSKSKI